MGNSVSMQLTGNFAIFCAKIASTSFGSASLALLLDAMVLRQSNFVTPGLGGELIGIFFRDGIMSWSKIRSISFRSPNKGPLAFFSNFTTFKEVSPCVTSTVSSVWQ